MSWAKATLKSLTEVIDYGLTASASNEVDGPLFLRITDLKVSGVDWADVPRCECDEKKKIKNLLKKGDIVFARTGATTGKSYLISKLNEETVFASYLIRVRVNEKVNSKYLAHFFKSPFYWHQIRGMSTGATLPGVNASKLGNLEIPLPPLDEQKRIAAILDKADRVRRKRQQAIELADDFLRSVFLDMFGDPVTNPKGWEVKKLKEFTFVTTGNTPSRKVPEYYGGELEWIKSDNINTPQHILTSATESLSEEGEKVARTVDKGSTLITCIAGSFNCIGNAALADRKVSFNQQINALTPHVELVSEWFLYSLVLFSKKLIQNASTNSMKGMISKGKLEEVEMILPPLKKQQKFEELLKQQLALIDKMNNSSLESTHNFNALSQKAFAGEL